MASVANETSLVRPVNPRSCVSRDFVTGESMSVGDVVYLRNDGMVARADADAHGSAYALGIVMTRATNTGFLGHSATLASGSTVAVLMQGLITGYTIASTLVGEPVWVSTMPGHVEDARPTASGDTAFAIGRALKSGANGTGQIYIDPGSQLPTVNA